MSLRMGSDPKRGKPRRNTAEVFFDLREQENKELSFNPDAELTEERLQAIVEYLTELKKNNEWEEFCGTICLGAPFSTLRERLPADLFDEETFQGVRNSIESSPDENVVYAGSVIIKTAILSRFYPNRSGEFSDQVTAAENLAKKTMSDCIRHRDSFNAYGSGVVFLLIAPERKKELPFTEATLNSTLQEFDDAYGQFLVTGSPQTDPTTFSLIFANAASIAAIHPEQKRKIPIDAGAMQKGEQSLRVFAEKQEWKEFIGLLHSMTTLTSERTEIPRPGEIRFIPRGPKIETKPTLPLQQEYS